MRAQDNESYRPATAGNFNENAILDTSQVQKPPFQATRFWNRNTNSNYMQQLRQQAIAARARGKGR